MTDQNDSTQHWTNLWRTGVLHSSSVSSINDNYDGETADFWNMQFESLTAGDRIVDLGTGNGAVLLLAKKHHAPFELHGVDSASIDPGTDTGATNHDYKGIVFHPDCSMSRLPFADGSAQLVTSQFAFEYAHRELALAEVLRITDPAHGRIAMILHSTDSEISKMSELQLEAFHFVFDELDIVRKALLLADALNLSDGHADLRDKYRLAFNDAAAQLMSRVATADHAPILDTVYTLLRRAMSTLSSSPANSVKLLRATDSQMRSERQRLLEMQRAAQTAQQLHALEQLLVEEGLGVSIAPHLQQGSKMGWELVACRA